MYAIFQRMALSAMGGYMPSPARIRRSIIGGAIIAIFLLTAYVAAVIGAAIYVAEQEGAVMASFLVAAIAAASALVTMAIVSHLNRRAQIRAMMMMQAQPAVSLQSQLLGALGPDVNLLVRQSPIASVVVVAALAYALARSQGLGRK